MMRVKVKTSAVVRTAIIIFLSSAVLTGPLRYLLSRVGMYPLIYLPKLLLLFLIPSLALAQGKINYVFMLVAALLLISTAWGIANLPSPLQALFGIWIIATFIFGLYSGAYVLDELSNYRGPFTILFLIACAGVFLNPYMHYPWVGENISFAGTELEVARKWSAWSVARYAGFARVSINAAAQLLMFAIWIMCTHARRIWRLFVWFMAGVGIALTSAKGPIASYIILTFYFSSGALMRHAIWWRRLWIAILQTLVIALVMLPISSIYISYNLVYDSFVQRFLLTSLGDRLEWMWPDSLKMLKSTQDWVFGLGLGGIGSAQEFFDPKNFLAGDNMFVFMVVNFGIVVSILFFLWLTIAISRKFILDNNRLMFAIALFVFSYGIVIDVLDGDGLLALALAWLIIWASRSPKASRLQFMSAPASR